MKQMYVYIMTNRKNGTLYVGVTSNLLKRVWEHKNHVVQGFTQRYNLNKLVYYEILDDEINAIKREKQLKNWHREWKINQINKQNPMWRDLFEDICC